MAPFFYSPNPSAVHLHHSALPIDPMLPLGIGRPFVLTPDTEDPSAEPRAASMLFVGRLVAIMASVDEKYMVLEPVEGEVPRRSFFRAMQFLDVLRMNCEENDKASRPVHTWSSQASGDGPPRLYVHLATHTYRSYYFWGQNASNEWIGTDPLGGRAGLPAVLEVGATLVCKVYPVFVERRIVPAHGSCTLSATYWVLKSVYLCRLLSPGVTSSSGCPHMTDYIRSEFVRLPYPPSSALYENPDTNPDDEWLRLYS